MILEYQENRFVTCLDARTVVARTGFHVYSKGERDLGYTRSRILPALPGYVRRYTWMMTETTVGGVVGARFVFSDIEAPAATPEGA